VRGVPHVSECRPERSGDCSESRRATLGQEDGRREGEGGEGGVDRGTAPSAGAGPAARGRSHGAAAVGFRGGLASAADDADGDDKLRHASSSGQPNHGDGVPLLPRRRVPPVGASSGLDIGDASAPAQSSSDARSSRGAARSNADVRGPPLEQQIREFLGARTRLPGQLILVSLPNSISFFRLNYSPTANSTEIATCHTDTS